MERGGSLHNPRKINYHLLDSFMNEEMLFLADQQQLRYLKLVQIHSVYILFISIIFAIYRMD